MSASRWSAITPASSACSRCAWEGADGHDRDPGGRRARGRGGGERLQERGAAAPLRDALDARALGGAERAGAGRRAHHDPGPRAPGRTRHPERRRARGGGRAGCGRVHRGALRAGEDDARVLPRAGAAPRAFRPRARLDPRRLRHRRAARRPPPERPPEAGRAAPHQRGLRGAKIVLDFPSVGATQQLMMAAALAEGTTVLENAAREPENVCLARALARMGAGVRGAGTSEVTLEGRPELGGGEHTVIPDRIEVGTFMVAAAVTGGAVQVTGARAVHLEAFLAELGEAGVAVRERESGIRVEGNGKLAAVDARTMPYPGFPTDLQAQFMTLMTRATGTSTLTEIGRAHV